MQKKVKKLVQDVAEKLGDDLVDHLAEGERLDAKGGSAAASASTADHRQRAGAGTAGRARVVNVTWKRRRSTCPRSPRPWST
jgi:hypothetical protein